MPATIPRLGTRATLATMEAAPTRAAVTVRAVIYERQLNGLWESDGATFRTADFREDCLRARARWVRYPVGPITLGGQPTVAEMEAAPYAAVVTNGRAGSAFTKDADGRWVNNNNGARHRASAFAARLDDYIWSTYPHAPRFEDLPQVTVHTGTNMPFDGEWEGGTLRHLVCRPPGGADVHRAA